MWYKNCRSHLMKITIILFVCFSGIIFQSKGQDDRYIEILKGYDSTNADSFRVSQIHGKDGWTDDTTWSEGINLIGSTLNFDTSYHRVVFQKFSSDHGIVCYNNGNRDFYCFSPGAVLIEFSK